MGVLDSAPSAAGFARGTKRGLRAIKTGEFNIDATKADETPVLLICQAGAGLEAQVFSEFLSLVPEPNQFHDILNKIFRKKIKRAKVRHSRVPRYRESYLASRSRSCAPTIETSVLGGYMKVLCPRVGQWLT